MKENKSINLIEGSIWKSILWFSIPLLIGNLFQQLYHTADSFVVGNYVGKDALAAVGASTPIINMLIGFFMGMAAGAGVIISQYFGSKDKDKLRLSIHTSLALTLILAVIITIVGVVFATPILNLIGVPKDIMPYTSLYLKIYFWGIIFVLIYNMGSGILRAIGDSRRPLIFLIISSVVNIILVVLFVCVFNWGVAGAGFATMIAQALSAFLVMFTLIKSKEDYQVVIKDITIDKPMLKKIIMIGLPSGLQQSVVSLSNVIVQSYVNGFGSAVVAGYSSYIRIDSFLNLALQSFNMAVTTFVGQNMGANKFKRVKKGAMTTWLMASIVVVISTILIVIGGKNLIMAFNSDENVVNAGYKMLIVFTPFYIVLPFVQVMSGVLRGAGKTQVPMYIQVVNFCILRQIYLWIVMKFSHDIIFVYLGWPVTWVTCTICLMIYYFKVDWLPRDEEKAL